MARTVCIPGALDVTQLSEPTNDRQFLFSHTAKWCGTASVLLATLPSLLTAVAEPFLRQKLRRCFFLFFLFIPFSLCSIEISIHSLFAFASAKQPSFDRNCFILPNQSFIQFKNNKAIRLAKIATLVPVAAHRQEEHKPTARIAHQTLQRNQTINN